ncbi:MAG: MBL fold metallo-hydrolase [Proteobacteria bacterium]|nr:MBL fold metallo-hydrolase [Pseudomonadota bacterium]
MPHRIPSVLLAALLFASAGMAASYDADTVGTGDEALVLTFIGHGTLMFEYGGVVVHADPTLRESDYEGLPKADLILITHEHGDHLDPTAVTRLRKPDTEIIANPGSAGKLDGAVVIKNGETRMAKGLKVEAVPAYNIVHMRSEGQPFHPKGVGNGYIVTFGDKRVYIAGDTENTPEMKQLKTIDIAFLPMNLPYTMTPEMVADAANAFRPKILYPYHFGNTATSRLVDLLKDNKDIEVRMRRME